MHQFHGRWIVDPRFLSVAPINIYHKQCDASFVWEHPEDLQNLHMLVRHDFSCDPTQAEKILLYFSADDFAKIRINGETIAYGPSQGYYFHYYYNCVDITAYVKTGTNRIDADILYQGVINRYTNSGDLRMGFIADIVALCDEKERLISCTEEGAGWEYAISRAYTSLDTYGYQTQFRENYDTRTEPKEADFAPCICKETDHVLSEEAVTVQLYQIPLKKGESLADGGIFFCDRKCIISFCMTVSLTKPSI